MRTLSKHKETVQHLSIVRVPQPQPRPQPQQCQQPGSPETARHNANGNGNNRIGSSSAACATWLISASSDKTVMVWDTETWVRCAAPSRRGVIPRAAAKTAGSHFFSRVVPVMFWNQGVFLKLTLPPLNWARLPRRNTK